MHRALIGFLSAALLSGCASHAGHTKRTIDIAGQTSCTKHRIPLITVRGFESKPLMLVHDADPRSVPCDERSPNRIWDSQNLARDHLRPVRALITYCPRCAAEFWQCMGGDHRLTEADTQQITSLVMRRSDFPHPLIRIFPVYEQRALAIGGHEDHVDDVFSDIGLTRRHGCWFISSQADSHRILALGRHR
jgi:hypothetical protein